MTEGISSSVSSTDYLSILQSATSSSSSSSSSSSTETKTTNEIISELKQNAMASTMSAQDIADEYGISLAKAQQILEELQGTDEDTAEKLPEGSTVSYQV